LLEDCIEPKHDLHVHTNFSDGLLSPEEVMALYAANHFTTVAITDHDNIEGSLRARRVAADYGIRIVPGVEISTLHEGRDVHILGYGCSEAPILIELLDFIVQQRLARAEKMVERLESIWGFHIQMKRLLELAGDNDVVGRPHIARALVEGGYCRDLQEAFIRYIGDDCPGYVAKQSVPPAEAIRVVREAGGIPVLAHPMFLEHDFVILDLIDMGLGGMEVFYLRHSSDATEFYRHVAQRYGLLCTGGSDFHGSDYDREQLAGFSVPDWTVQELFKRLGT